MKFSAQIKGIDRVRTFIKHNQDKVNRAPMAMRTIAEEWMTEVKRRIPVADPAWYVQQGYGKYPGVPGTLRSTAHVEQNTLFKVRLVVGGPAAGYAVAVHENLLARHPNGQAKYLESVVIEKRATWAQDMIDLMSSGGGGAGSNSEGGDFEVGED